MKRCEKPGAFLQTRNASSSTLASSTRNAPIVLMTMRVDNVYGTKVG